MSHRLRQGVLLSSALLAASMICTGTPTASAAFAEAIRTPVVVQGFSTLSPITTTRSQAIVNAAASQAGLPYCWDGGTTSGPSHGHGDYDGEAPDCIKVDTIGFDCSGLALYTIYQATGIVLPHNAAEQGADYANYGGTLISSESDLKPGDLVYFGGGSMAKAAHVGIYAGGGYMWDANTAWVSYPDGVHERSVSRTEEGSAGLPFDGGVRYWTGTQGVPDAPVSLSELKSAPVPPLRGNPAGHLVNGILPTPTQGRVELLTGAVEGTGTPYVGPLGAAPAFGNFTGNGVGDAAADILATSGAGGVDQFVTLYANEPRLTLLATFDPAVAAAAHHATVMALAIRDGEVLVDWEADAYPLHNTPPFWSAHLRWADGRIVVRDLVRHTGAADRHLWSNPTLTITPTSLGAVRVDMTLSAAADAAGLFFQPVGDGVIEPEMPEGYANLFVYTGDGDRVTCVGAGGVPSDQKVSTPAGFVLGGSVATLKRIYGHLLRYVPAPSHGGMSDFAGYVLPGPHGNLVFVVSWERNNLIGEIAAGRGIGPNSCPG
jgi:cell wall-associated NlpC family hydrolase